MRSLAATLGVTPMAIYRHVRDKRGLVQLLIDDVWASVAAALDADADDLVEFLVGVALTTRRIWLENLELANLAMAVAPADDNLVTTSALTAQITEAAGFPDVPLAYGAVLTFTMGAVATAANRRVSSAYFGRDPDAVLADARRLLDQHDADAATRGIVESRFDELDFAHFEPALRALVRGLLAAPTDDRSSTAR